MPMTAKELRENRAKLVPQMRALADRQPTWTDEDRANWKRLDGEFERLSVEISTAERETEMRSPIGDPAIGRHDPTRNNPVARRLMGDAVAAELPQPDFGLRFRDQNGRILRALQPQESFAAASVGEPLAPGAVGRCLAAALTGRIDELPSAERRAFLDHTTTTGGYLLNPVLSASVMDLARSQSVAVRAGMLTMPIEGEHRIASITGDPTAHWRDEGSAVTASSMTFGRLDLVPKTIAAIIPVSIEMLEDSSNIGAVIEMALAGVFGLAIDRAVLSGAGSASNEPEGVVTNTSVNEIDANGARLDYSLGRQAVTAVRNANCATPSENMAWIMSPREAATLDSLVTGDGVWLTPPPSLAKMPWLTTTSVPTNLGTGTNESYALLGDFSTVLLAMRKTLTIRILESGQATDDAESPVTHNAASELKKLIVAHARCDVGLLRPSWLAKITAVGPLSE